MLSTLRIAWRNLGRNRKRTALALTAIAIAQVALLMMDSLVQGYTDAMLDTITGPMVGHVQVHAPKFREERALDEVVPDLTAKLAAIRADPGVARASARAFAPVLLAKEMDSVAGVVIGVDPANEAGPTGLLAGSPAGVALGERRAFLGKNIAKDLGVVVGSRIAVVGQGADGSIANDLFEVAGIVSSPVDMINRLGVLVALPDAQAFLALGDDAHEIVIVAVNPDLAGEVATRLAATPAMAGLEVLDWRGLVPELANIIDLSAASSLIILLLVFIASAAGIANTMLMATFERSHELGMLLALGCGPGRIVRMIITESIVLGLAGVAVGSVVGSALVLFAGINGINLGTLGGGGVTEMAYEGLNFSFLVFPRLAPQHIISGVLAVLFTSMVASIWPAVHAARLQPVEAMRA